MNDLQKKSPTDMEDKMPQHPETVASLIAQLGGSKLSFVGKEVNALPEILQDGELLLAVASGQIDNSVHLLAITDSRLLLVLRSTLKQSNFEIPITDVRGINIKSGMLMAELEINAGGQLKKLVSVDKQLAQKVAQTFSSLRAGEPIPDQPSPDPPKENASVSADHLRHAAPDPEAQLPKKKSLWLKACVVIAIAFVIFVAVIPGKQKAPAIPQDMRSELRALYLDLEGFFKAGKLQQKDWIFTEERSAWMDRLKEMGGGLILDQSEVDPKATEAVRNVAQNIHSLETELNMNTGRFNGLYEDRLKNVLDAIKTGPSDNIGADMLQLAAQHVAQATPEKKAMVQKEREAQQREQDKPRLEATIKKLHKDITEVSILYLDDRQRINITYTQDWVFKPFFTIGEQAKSILQKMTQDGLVGDTTDVACHVRVPTTDQYGNKGTSPGLSLTWDGTTLGKINWNNMFGPQFLNLCTRVEVRPLMQDMFEEFAANADNQKNYQGFIIKALQGKRRSR